MILPFLPAPSGMKKAHTSPPQRCNRTGVGVCRYQIVRFCAHVLARYLGGKKDWRLVVSCRENVVVVLVVIRCKKNTIRPSTIPLALRLATADYKPPLFLVGRYYVPGGDMTGGTLARRCHHAAGAATMGMPWNASTTRTDRITSSSHDALPHTIDRYLLVVVASRMS
jgi:hypothetical protein